jgi:Putative prokaryotic signal transducing protein
MDLPRENELLETYRSASDGELLDLALTYDSLTEVAQNALRGEFARRGLEPPVIPDPAPEAEMLPVVTVQQYRDLTEAQLAMGVLESAGIPCYLRDENTVRTQWFWSNLIGGIRLQVREEDRAAAEALLNPPTPGQIPVDDETP